MTAPGSASHFYPRPPRGGRRIIVSPPSYKVAFLSTPSARRATTGHCAERQRRSNFYPRPPRGGRPLRFLTQSTPPIFLSTPSARRATQKGFARAAWPDISIHALREEGDRLLKCASSLDEYFYPRPPRGGRRLLHTSYLCIETFLSTPSARRATNGRPSARTAVSRFLSTPSARRATHNQLVLESALCISIHALREEGDPQSAGSGICTVYFYPRPPRGGRRTAAFRSLHPSLFLSTPSARRATQRHGRHDPDAEHFYPRPPRGGRRTDTYECFKRRIISIHALREEGDQPSPLHRPQRSHFYPRPPRGGRHLRYAEWICSE